MGTKDWYVLQDDVSKKVTKKMLLSAEQSTIGAIVPKISFPGEQARDVRITGYIPRPDHCTVLLVVPKTENKVKPIVRFVIENESGSRAALGSVTQRESPKVGEIVTLQIKVIVADVLQPGTNHPTVIVHKAD